MLIDKIKVENFLSFGPDGRELCLKKLNLLIGPNGSGKSNFIEGIDLLRSAPKCLSEPILLGGGVQDWIWQGGPKPTTATLETIVKNPSGNQNLRYLISFENRAQRFELVREFLGNETAYAGHDQPYIYYEQSGGHATLNYKDKSKRQLQPEEILHSESILSQRKDPDHYPELYYLGDALGRIRLYREWRFGRDTPCRIPQKADQPNEFLKEDGSNLGLILSKIRQNPQAKQKLLNALSQLYEGISDFEVFIQGGTVQVFIEENQFTIPATRLSDGTVRYLCLLAILCHPSPPPLVCIEEPELGMHPDILPTLAKLLEEAAELGQLIVTTHSEILVDALSNSPEYVVVCEKRNGKTEMRRLDSKDLKDWLAHYSLGQLWSKGEIGGNRW